MWIQKHELVVRHFRLWFVERLHEPDGLAGWPVDAMQAHSLTVCFRTDASLQIGSGHVMRCLALANCLRRQGAECRFVCREHPGHLIKEIRAQGYPVAVLPRPDSHSGISDHDADPLPAHAHWLGVASATDAKETRQALGADKVDWLVVDHYALEGHWEKCLRPQCRNVLVIDDLADRSHDCDVLLDQGFGRRVDHYSGLVPRYCTLLLGTGYALQRPEFANLRAYSLQRRPSTSLRQVMVSMGGVDQVDATSRVLDALDGSRLPPDCRIVVVMGPHAPWTEKVRGRAEAMDRSCDVVVDAKDVAQIMADSDLAIGAGGGMAWERCTLGLPAIIVVLAENQRGVAAAMEQAGAAQVIADVDSIANRLPQCLANMEGDGIDRCSRAASAICDGEGSRRVVAVLAGGGCQIRHMSAADLAMVLRWRNSETVRRFMYTQRCITESEHAAWFDRVASDDRHHLLIVEEAGQPLGFVQFKQCSDSPDRAEWGFYAAPDASPGSGTKLARAALAYAFEELGYHRIHGEAISYNNRSIAFHRKLGFRDHGVCKGQYFDGECHHDVHDFELSAQTWRRQR